MSINPEKEFGARNWQIAVKRTADCLLISGSQKFAIQCGLKALANNGRLLGVKVLVVETSPEEMMSGYVDRTSWYFSNPSLAQLKNFLYEEALEYNEEHERYLNEVQKLILDRLKKYEDIDVICKTFDVFKTQDIEEFLAEKIKRREKKAAWSQPKTQPSGWYRKRVFVIYFFLPAPTSSAWVKNSIPYFQHLKILQNKTLKNYNPSQDFDAV